MTSIVALAGIELETPNLAETAKYYEEGFGLSVSERTEDSCSLKGSGTIVNQLTLKAGAESRLAALKFLLDPSQDLDRFSADLEKAGQQVNRISEDTIGLDDPDGNRILVTHDKSWSEDCLTASTDRPITLSHAVLNSPNAPALVQFYVDVLGFRVTDRYEANILTFLQANQKQHHCIAIAANDHVGLHHFAMDCGGIDGIMRSVGRLKSTGHDPLWGPGRHAPGGNIFCYFKDPSGFVPELTSDLIQIEDFSKWEIKTWPRKPESANMWRNADPSAEAIAAMAEG